MAPHGTPHSHLGILCLPMSHRKDAMLIWINKKTCIQPFALLRTTEEEEYKDSFMTDCSKAEVSVVAHLHILNRLLYVL